MIKDKSVGVQTYTMVDDGYGGEVPSWTTQETFMASVQPLSSELMLKQYGIATTTAIEIYSKSKVKISEVKARLAVKDIRLSIDGVRYKVLSNLEYKKHSEIVGEVDES